MEMMSSIQTEPPWLAPRTAYIHIPFCAHKCGYCDFAVTAGKDHLIDLYLEALELEVSGLGTPYPVQSIFIGGGTPTRLSPPSLERLLTVICQWLPLAPVPGETAAEFSIESNPENLDADRVRVLAEFGVNRVSVGVQSFDQRFLTALERQHTATEVGKAIDAVRQRIDNVSLDLIFAAPGQTLADWQVDLDRALAFEPNHISTYGLTYEKGTPLWKARQKGRVDPVPEESELEMYLHSIDRLGEAGLAHYEISNFARPGQESRHNQRYWANHAYHGFGVGAARYVQGRRELNIRNTESYIRRLLAGESPTFQREELSPRERAFETVSTQIRRREGIEHLEFAAQTGFRADQLLGEAVAELAQLGLLETDSTGFRLTRHGKCLADAIVIRLLREQ